MKRRFTLSVDPPEAVRAKKLAYARQTGDKGTSFVECWAGKFTVARAQRRDPRMKALKAKHRLKACR